MGSAGLVGTSEWGDGVPARAEKEKGPWLGKPRARVAAIEVWVFGGGNSR
jgi:hypothetical protein